MTDGRAARHLEDATDALARLDAACGYAPRALETILRLSAIAQLFDDPSKATRSLIALFAGAPMDGAGEARRWLDLVDDEERRARGGAPLSLVRLTAAGLASADHEAIGHVRSVGIERSLKSDGNPRPSALHRALGAAATIGDRALGEIAAALVLCAEGRTYRIRMLPFAGATGVVRADAIARWRDGDEEQWTSLALEALAHSAHTARIALERSAAGIPSEDAAFASLGRGGITARRALLYLRTELATTVPMLADALGLSRPAADDALGRLTHLGIVTEVTGRRRERVFAWSSALGAVIPAVTPATDLATT